MSPSTTISPLKEQLLSFGCHIERSFNSKFKKQINLYNSAINSHYYEATLPFLKSVQKLHYVIKVLLNEYFPDAQLSGYQKIAFESFTGGLLTLADIAGKLKNITNMVKVIKLRSSIIKTKEMRKKAEKSKNPTEIWLAKLKTFTTVEAIFDTPDKIYKFIILFYKPVTVVFKQITVHCSAIALIFSIAGPILNGHQCYTTSQFIDILDAKRYRAFIKEYSDAGGFAVPAVPLKNLSTAKLKEHSLQIEQELTAGGKFDHLTEIQHKANIVYINSVQKKIKKDSSLIETQFKIVSVKSETDEKTKKTFFDKLSSKRIQSEPERVSAIVKNLNDRLHHKVSSDKVSIISKCLSFIPSIFNSFVSVGTLYFPHLIVSGALAPIASAITGVLAFAAVVDIFFRHHQEQNFIESMEELVKKSPFDSLWASEL